MALENGERKSEKAVSPVIGVILIVAITVILGAVVGTAALGFGDQVQQNARAGVSVEFNQEDNSIKVNWIDEGNADRINVTLTGDVEYQGAGTSSSDGPVELTSAGSSITISPPGDGNGIATVGDVGHYDNGNRDSGVESKMIPFPNSDPGIPEGSSVTVSVVATTEDGSKTTVLTKKGEF